MGEARHHPVLPHRWSRHVARRSAGVLRQDSTEARSRRCQVRVVPPGTVRYGAFCKPGVVVMPGFVNIGARVGSGTMVDTWATVGSCAQIGRDVHLSGGVGIGGVLSRRRRRAGDRRGRRLSAAVASSSRGSSSKGAVLGANTTITASTPDHRCHRLATRRAPRSGTRQLGRDPWHPSQAIPRRLVRPAMRIDRGQAHRVHRP